MQRARAAFGFCGYTTLRYQSMAYQNPGKHLHEYRGRIEK